MLRKSLLWLSQQDSIFRLVRSNPLAWKFASRFVAGESIEEGVAVASQLATRGITASLDLLGESVSRPEEAVKAKDEYLRMLDQMAQAGGIEVNVSVKLTQMGFDIDEELCLQNMREILTRASELNGFVRLDMESSEYTQRTLDFFADKLYPSFANHCGVVIQSALRRSEADIDKLIRMGARVRLCKGAYLEPASVAFPEKADVDANYIKLMERLLLEGNYPGLATHDPAIITHARDFVSRNSIAADKFEFQMLYGVRRDLQHQLRDAGHRMRVYVAFGRQWYPYLMRRLAERPANIAFMLGNLVKESVSRG